jgi:hypothetical protein
MSDVNSAIDNIQTLMKALEAGSYNAAPSTLVQGASLMIEDVSPVMQNVTFDDEHIKLQKMLSVESCKSTLAQFDRQLSYGHFGGSAQLEGNVGQEATSDFVRITVPMAYYSHVRRVTLVANMVATVDGKKAEDRAASDAAKKVAGDIEFDLFRGKADFSNAGVYDGNPLTMAVLPNVLGLDAQIRQSDDLRNGRDLMFAEYGSDESVVIPGGGILSQDNIEDASVRSAMNMGSADKLVVDPKVLSQYNKIAFGKERIILAGSAQDATGADLRRQWVSGGTVSIEASRFLSGKTRPARPRPQGPGAPQAVATANVAGQGTAFVAGQVYRYFATSVNEVGESMWTAAGAHTINALGDAVTVTITHPAAGTVRFFNVYRSVAGGGVATAKFIGRVVRSDAATTAFTDLGNKLPGFVTGFLIQGDTMGIKELSSYSRLKLAVTDLSIPEAHFRFCTLAVFQPRKNVLVDNLRSW